MAKNETGRAAVSKKKKSSFYLYFIYYSFIDFDRNSRMQTVWTLIRRRIL